MPPGAHIDLSRLDAATLLDDIDGIRAINPQRFEMEQLTGIFFVDLENGLFAGFKDVCPDEFWTRGHMPGYPIYPGVLMCEAAAQLCSYFVTKVGKQAGDFLGFGGLENVRFRAPVRVGDRILLVAKVLKLHPRQMIFNVQGFVGQTMVFHADVVGVPMRRKDG